MSYLIDRGPFPYISDCYRAHFIPSFDLEIPAPHWGACGITEKGGEEDELEPNSLNLGVLQI